MVIFVLGKATRGKATSGGKRIGRAAEKGRGDGYKDLALRPN